MKDYDINSLEQPESPFIRVDIQSPEHMVEVLPDEMPDHGAVDLEKIDDKKSEDENLEEYDEDQLSFITNKFQTIKSNVAGKHSRRPS